MTYRPEPQDGFSPDEAALYAAPKGWDCIEGDDKPLPESYVGMMEEACQLAHEQEVEDMDDEDYGEYVDEQEAAYEDDGQPSEYDEWQDVYGGDDWDHGQYDDFC